MKRAVAWAGAWLTLAAAWGAPPATAARGAVGLAEVRELMSEDAAARARAAARLEAAGDRTLLPPIVDALFFVPVRHRAEALGVLRALAGVDRGARYLDWVEWLGEHPEVAPPADYLNWKANLLARIDLRYKGILHPDAAVRVPLPEVVWGGVKVEGIPTLDDPPSVPAGEADFLDPGERVFGIRVAGESRAYPQRVLSWHEMVNDVVGGKAVVLSYCTLCGSAIAYEAGEGSGRRLFGTSGLLFRGNKLMIDRQTLSLWSNLTGEAVIGPQAAERRSLTRLPITVTRWDEWRAMNPSTRVMRVDPAAGARHGYVYRAGAAEAARAGVRFPHGPRSARLPPAAEVLAVRAGEAAKAYPVEALGGPLVLNDRVGDTALVVVVTAPGAGPRVYARAAHTFFLAPEPLALVDASGARWRVDEEALRREGGAGPAGEGEELERLPAHLAFWAGWFGFHPHTEVFEAESGGERVLPSGAPPEGGS